MLAALDPALLRQIKLLEIHDSLPSTNERLLQLPATPSAGSLAVCLASHQSAGRGRNGKAWHSPPGAGLLLSVGRAAPRPPDGSLALALGAAIAEVLESFVSDRVELKWPNDLIAQDRKLGGILIETSTQAAVPAPTPPTDEDLGERAPHPPPGTRTSRPRRRRDAFAPRGSAQDGAEFRVVAGLGVNVWLTDEQREWVAKEGGMAPVALSQLNQRRPPEPNTLAAAMITAIAAVLEEHPADGFARWEDAWHQRDWLAGRRIEALCGVDRHSGEAAGVDSSGALLLKDSTGERRILSAEIEL